MKGNIKIFVCGDIVNLARNNNFIGQKLAEEIRSSDFAIGNLEGVEFKADQGVPNRPAQNAGTIHFLRETGFNMLLLANNHITDFGAEQMRYTIGEIEKEGMLHIGAGFSWEDTYKPVVIDINGIRFGFINVCEAQVGHMQDPFQSFGYAWMGYDKIFEDVARLAQTVDKVIVFVHAGLEHYKLPLPELRAFYRHLCDVGASAVIGSHPHITQGFETYNHSFIAYSLGNFYFPHKKGEYEEENNSFSFILNFDEDGCITTNIIHHSVSGEKVEIEPVIEKQVDIHNLCSLLEDRYEDSALEMCCNAYDTLCNRLIIQATCGEKNNITILNLMKSMLRRTIFRKKYISSTKSQRDRLLLRLFENESYRYTIIRALKKMNQ